jgi:ribonucleotide reductase alpha subunit
MLNIHMQVIKRSGKTEQVSFDKVTKRIKLLCGGLENVDPILIAQKVCGEIYNNVHTYELDELAAQICVAMSTENPKFGILASRIIISNNHKTTSPSFSETMTALYNNRDILGKHTPMLAEDVYQVIMKHKDKLNNVIDYKRDYNFDYFAFKTLEKAYLFKINNVIVERVQHMFMRVSIGIHSNDIGKAIESYNFMSQKYFTHATPTLYNAGTPRPQNSSCFLLGTDDSIESMYSTIKDCALISKWAGGIGIHISNIRSKGTHIRGTNGKSDGIIPMLKVYNETAVHVNQGGGKRPGAFAIYLEPHHPDIMQFLDLKKNHGNEEERARDLFSSMDL